MIILDTSLWIEFFRNNDPFMGHISKELGKGSIIGLPWIFGELIQGARDVSEIKMLNRTWNAILKPELSILEKAWLIGGEESQKGRWFNKGVGLIDAAIIAAAKEIDCHVWSLDKKLCEILKFKKMLFVL